MSYWVIILNLEYIFEIIYQVNTNAKKSQQQTP